MKQSSKTVLLIIAILLMPVIVGLQHKIDPLRKQFQPPKPVTSMSVEVNNNPAVLPGQYMVASMLGFREVVAGLLWVRCDDFFDAGQYEPMVPLMRMITWLDPHQINVYCTGAWHLAYNFVDSDQRADHRYLPAAIALLEEGIANNPGVSEPEQNLGFVIYELKSMDFDKAAYWLLKSSEEKDATFTTSRLLAHAYEKGGHIDEAIRQWKKCIADGLAALAKNPKNPDAALQAQVSKNNLEGLLERVAARVDIAKHQVDVNLDAQFRRVGPCHFVVSGSANLPNATRIDLELLDADFKEPTFRTFRWDVDQRVTALVEVGIHGVLLKDHKFHRDYNLINDPGQYPFKKDQYVLILYVNPREQSEGVQDVTGWSGEGITDKQYLDTSTPGLRKIVKIIHLSRKEII